MDALAASLLQYLGGEPCAVCGHCLTATDAKPAMPSSLPNEILPGFLFLGSYDHASRAELLKALGIGHILNVRPALTPCIVRLGEESLAVPVLQLR